jgi:hypothetical protein
MPFTFADLDIRTTLPDIPASAPVVSLTPPCIKDRSRAVEGLTKALGFEVRGTVDVPHGYAVGGPSGQVEVFYASGAVRGRNTDQLSKFEDERRRWADVTKDEDHDGVFFRLGDAAAQRLTTSSMRLLDSIGLSGDHASLTVALGQWARLDESGAEIDSGPGRATVQLGYEAEGIRLIGPGAKTNFHYDPDDSGEPGIMARFFHVLRGTEGVKDLRMLTIEEAFQPLLTQTWSGLKVDPTSAKMAITSATFGLLALPADVPQTYAAPALVVEGRLEGVLAEDGRLVELRFGQYLPLANAKGLADAGFASSGPVLPGSVVAGRARGR